MRIVLFCSLLTLSACQSNAVRSKSDADARPTAEPRIFAEGIISTGLSERDGSLSADGEVFAFTLQSGIGNAILLSRSDGLTWSEPELAPFSGRYADIEPCFDPRGERLWFASRRPLAGEEQAGDWNFWSVTYERSEHGWIWGEPQEVHGLNSPGPEFYPSVSRAGELVFTADREGGFGGEDLWLARHDGEQWTVRNAGAGVNTPGPEFNACIRPDGGAIVFSSVREGDQGRGDLYISERQSDGEFGPARPLTKLNSADLDYCPNYSADGEWFWFTSRRKKPNPPEAGWATLSDFRRALESAGNGQDDVYWVAASSLAD